MPQSYDKYNLYELRLIARGLGVCSPSKFSKRELIEIIEKKESVFQSCLQNISVERESLGCGNIDLRSLKEEFERQAKLAYRSGNYCLGEKNSYGQRVDIVIRLKNKETKETFSFVSGWIAYSNGELRLATPYGSDNERT